MTEEEGLAEIEIPEEEHDVACMVYKKTYSDGRAYRYEISDETGSPCYLAERTGMLLPSPTRLVEFFDLENRPFGRLQPPEVAPWLRATRYEVHIGEESEEPAAVITEQWRLVDILLLRLPRYEMQMGSQRYIIRGSRYGARLYGIYLPDNEQDREEEQEQEEEEEEQDEIVIALEELELEEIEEAEADEARIGEIQCPTAGPSYIVETEIESLRQAPLVLAALVALIDMEMFS